MKVTFFTKVPELEWQEQAKVKTNASQRVSHLLLMRNERENEKNNRG